MAAAGRRVREGARVSRDGSAPESLREGRHRTRQAGRPCSRAWRIRARSTRSASRVTDGRVVAVIPKRARRKATDQ